MKNFIKHRLLAPEGEISSSNAPEVKSNNSALYESGDVNETFDDLEYESEASKKAGEEYKNRFKDKIAKAKANSTAKKEAQEDEGEKPLKAEKKEEKPKEKKTELATLSDKSDDDVEDKEVKPKEKAKDEEGSDETPEEKELSKEAKGKIKVRMGGELYGLEADSVVRYKVDNEWVERPLQEVLNKASGVEALDKKFTEYGQKNKELEVRTQQVEQTRKILQDTANEVVGILKDPEKNPFEAMQILVEKSGQDPYTVWRRTLEASLDEIEKLQSMNESERKAYFLERKDEFRTKADEARTKAYQEYEAHKKVVSDADALRQAHGVSEEQFMEAWDLLEAEGVKNPTDKDIVERASITPHLNSVQDILEPFEDFIEDSRYAEVVTDFARQLRAGKLTAEQLKEYAAEVFVDEDVKDLTVRKKAVEKKTQKEVEPPVVGKKGYDSFDDFE